jgi:hypothetical protein
MPESGIDEAARLVMSPPPWNPKTVDLAGVKEILDRSFEGRKNE